jgi:hypothetical protein
MRIQMLLLLLRVAGLLLQVLPGLWEEGCAEGVLQHHPLGTARCWGQRWQLAQAAQ